MGWLSDPLQLFFSQGTPRTSCFVLPVTWTWCMFVLTLLHSHSPHPSLCLHSCWSHRSASFSFSIHCIPAWRMTLKSGAKHTWFLPSSWQSSSVSCIFTDSLFCPLISSQDGLRQLSKYQTKFFIYLLLRNSYPSFNNQFNRFYCVGFHKPPLLILFFLEASLKPNPFQLYDLVTTMYLLFKIIVPWEEILFVFDVSIHTPYPCAWII